MSWAAYTETARQLSTVRRDAAEQHSAHQSTVTTAQADLDRLTIFLNAQRERIVALAQVLRLPPPFLDNIPRSSEIDVQTALHLAADAAKFADSYARQAEDRARQPTLLPGMSPTPRNALIYSAWAFVCFIAQCGLAAAASDSFGFFAWSLCGLPAIAFFGGYATIAFGGQPRMAEGQYPRNPQIGGLICFVGLPIAWLFLTAALSLIGNF